ncbi:MAG: hypothetical protein RBU25_04935 [Lentisphaeria bacterium]|jgi:hypothetical protein|nr:hypothetical protein [Lentisphaeria bacterium]
MKHLFLALFCGIMVQARELVPRWADDFGQYQHLADAHGHWAFEGQGWRLEPGLLVAASSQGTMFGTPRRAPSAGRQVIELELTVRQRLSAASWAVASLLVQQDRQNYWQLAFCEGPPPERQRYVELGENFRGQWKANAEGPHALAVRPAKGSFVWEYGVPYRLRLAIDESEIRGSVLAADGNLLGEFAYELRAGYCVATGQAGLRMIGFEAAVDRIQVMAEPPPDPVELGLDIVAGPKGRVALLADPRFPGYDEALLADYAAALTKEGFGVTRLTAAELARPGVLSTDHFEVFSLIPADVYPAAAGDAIRGFLRGGGHLLAVGGKPFAEPCLDTPAGWLSRNEVRQKLRETPPSHLLLPFAAAAETEGWARGSNNLGKTDSAISFENDGGQPCARFAIRGYSGWDTFAKDIPGTPFPEANELTCLRLRATPQTTAIAVEWRERDGSRWIATVPAGPDWRQVALTPDDFQFWKQGSPPERGTGNDRLNPKAAVQLSFGVAGSHTAIPPGDHTFWVAGVGTAPWPMDKTVLAEVEPLDLGMFSDAYSWERLEGTTRLTWAGGGKELAVAATGPAVLGFPKPGLSVFRPLLSAYDARGRRQAHAGGMLIHHGGVYQGGRWAVYTPKNPDLLANPEFLAGVADVAAGTLAAPVCIVRAEPERLSYEPGQTFTVPVVLCNQGQDTVAATVVQVVLRDGELVQHNPEPQTVELIPLRTQEVSFSWQAPASAGRYTVHTQARVGEQAGDWLEEPVIVETPDPKLACRGPLKRDGRHLAYPDGSRFFAIGANYTGAFEAHGRFFLDEHFTPRTLEAHFRASREAGINSWRSCGWCWSAIWEEEILRGDFRKVDLYMDLAARYGVYQLIAPPGVHNLNLAKRLEVYTALAKHLRGHPALLGYDFQNEPGIVRMTGLKFPADRPCPTQQTDFVALYPEILEPRLDHLREMARARRVDQDAISPELTDEEAFRVVCANFLYWQWFREYGMSFSTFPEIDRAWPPAPKWQPLIDAVDAGLEAYVKVQADALRAADPDALVTVGYNQCFSVFPGNRHLDFVSHHVYQRPLRYEDVLTNITTLDRLAKVWPDQPITLGEFGYTSGIEMGNGFLTVHEGAVGEMIHWLYAIDRGYDGCKKWVLNDHPLAYMHHFGNWAGRGLPTQIYEERFGIYAWDGSPTGRIKPIGIALAALRRYIDRAGPVGKLEIREGGGNAKAFYRFAGDQALFLGANAHAEAGLEFTSDVPLNLFLDWGAGPLSLTATADVSLRLDPRRYLDRSPDRCRATGAETRMVGDQLELSLLAGQTATLAPR